MVFYLEQWHWWALCLGSMVMVPFIRSTFPIWMAVGSGILGGVAWLTPEVPSMYQFMLFVLITFGGVAISDLFVKRNPDADKERVPEEVRQAGERFIGRVVTLEEPIVNGFGRIVIEGEQWRVRGEDSPVGQEICVLEADGIDRDLLIVERVEEELV